MYVSYRFVLLVQLDHLGKEPVPCHWQSLEGTFRRSHGEVASMDECWIGVASWIFEVASVKHLYFNLLQLKG